LIETNPFKLKWDDVRLSTMDEFSAWFARDPFFDQEPKSMIYRGQACADWPLQSTLDRSEQKGASYTGRLTTEKDFIEEFRSTGFRFLGDIERRMVGRNAQGEKIGAMAVMRHFGAPTRVLDWSKSRAVAAYFSSVENSECDGAIWWIEDKAIEDSVHPHWERRRFERRCPKAGGHVILDSGIFREDVEAFVTMADFPVQFPRIKAQLGLFTIATRFDVLHDEALAEQVPATRRGRVIIERALKEKVINYLERLGINAHTLQHAGADQVGLHMAWKQGGR
jgi:hypothetical protein